ncbi:MAG: DUF2341 domain-containing protein [Hadesarchaea archaeon]|nr:DUF2341 domain-containing protein [Hadesarchaea archaeon]
MSSMPQAKASPSWWDTSWGNRRPITITGSHPQNYQLRITIPFDSDMNADYSDLRFLEDEESGELSYWIENYNSNAATVWVKRENNSDSTIYMYYNNSTAPSVSDGSSTFIFFENFNSYNPGELFGQGNWVSGWLDSQYGISVQSEITYEGEMAAKGTAEESNVWLDSPIDATSPNIRFVFHTMLSEHNPEEWSTAGLFDNVEEGYPIQYNGLSADWEIENLLIEDRGDAIAALAQTNNWYQFEILIKENESSGNGLDGLGSENELIHDLIVRNESGEKILEETGLSPGTPVMTADRVFLYFTPSGGGGDSPYWDLIWASEYVDPEPTASIGDEQVGVISRTTSSSSSSSISNASVDYTSSGDVTLGFSASTPPGTTSVPGTAIGYLEISASAPTSDITITLTLDPTAVSSLNIDLSTVTIYHWDGSSWDPLPTVRTGSYTFEAHVNSLSWFGVGGESQISGTETGATTFPQNVGAGESESTSNPEIIIFIVSLGIVAVALLVLIDSLKKN